MLIPCSRWICVLLLVWSASLEAQSRYPRVYGPTGRLYGPGRAFEAYHQQYGRPWHGYRGIPHRSNCSPNLIYGYYAPGYYHSGFIATPVYPGYGIYISGGYYPGVDYGYYEQQQTDYLGGYIHYGPAVLPRVPELPEVPDPDRDLEELARRREEAISRKIARAVEERLPTPSTIDQKIKATRLIGEGDIALRDQRLLQAYSKYKQAASAAPDQATARFRMAFTLAAMSQYASSVDSFKRGLDLDPDWPHSKGTLEEILGEDQGLYRRSILHEVSDWVRRDIRDPNRVFLLGVLLHWDGSTEQADQLLTAAEDLAGSSRYVPLFRQKPESKQIVPAGAEVPVQGNQEQVPDLQKKQIVPEGPEDRLPPFPEAPIPTEKNPPVSEEEPIQDGPQLPEIP